LNIVFDNKVAMVTGGASGIGLGCAELLATSGAKVAIADCDATRLLVATKQVQTQGIAKGYHLDVTDNAAIASTVNQIRLDIGEIDILVCSAGISIKKAARDTTEAEWDTTNSINIRGLFFCNQAVAAQSMIPHRAGVIINIASQSGFVGEPLNAAYCASKGGVVMLTRQEAVEWAEYNIRVNAVAPTWTRTDMVRRIEKDHPELIEDALTRIPLSRLAEVEDIAAAICFLASDQAKMITGAILPIDGGWTAQ
jgi:NAD(P)-dependent dehydrogenase (short-subunit alcohol dehydrogenase family)